MAALLLLPAAPAPSAAQSVGDADLTLGAQLRPRLETRDPAFPGGGASTFTSMRTRLSLLAALPGDVSAFVQLQDVRLFGEEGSTLADFSADGLDVHQAWLQLGDVGTPLELRVGRQEASYGGERLVGAVSWTQQARSFDGARLRWRPEAGSGGSGHAVDLFGYQISESAARPAAGDAAFYGAWADIDAGARRTLALFGLWNHAAAGAEAPADAPGGETNEVTVGARYAASSGPLTYRLEGAWQGGERAGSDLGAWLLAARIGTEVAGGAGNVAVWYDHLSGNDPDPAAPDRELGAFNTLYATNHKFYGYADLFLDIPAHTGGRGLRDLALKTSWIPADRWTLSADVHHFRVAEAGDLASDRLGEEIDLTVAHAYAGNLRVTGGLSSVFEGDALSPVRGIAEDVVFGYLMMDLLF